LDDYADKVAIVTGGGQGIGRSVVLEMAHRGGAVAIFDLNEEASADVVKEVTDGGGRALALQVDVSSRDQVEDGVARVVEEFGRVDVLVNNAGWTRTQLFVEDGQDYWEKVIGINLMGQIYTCRAVLEGMIDQGGGAIVNIASDAARVGTPKQAVYSAAKGGVISFSKSLVTEVGRHQVRVNVVSPSTTDTPLTRAALTDEQIERRHKVIPLRRIGQPEDQASAIVYLASDSASYITGQVLSVNGGSSRLG
jgi:NAD(P)-dependent dehydrogenase (short-subunit alcohol dehydrogenase family)